MNKRQKTVQREALKLEKEALEKLRVAYTQTIEDIDAHIKDILSGTQTPSKIRRAEYQRNLKKRISGCLEVLENNSFQTVDGYLKKCYENGFVGAAYDWQGQGVPLIIPIDPEQMLLAVTKSPDDIKISRRIYDDVEKLQNDTISEITRGVAQEFSYGKIARNIAMYGTAAMNRSFLIARTEGHRVQQEGTLHAQEKAVQKGADVLKQWDATLDGVTRPVHRDLDGQLKPVDEPFEAGGKTAMYPGGFGDPSEDCNCRCCLLQRAKWALTDDEYITKMDGDANELVRIKEKDYDKFKATYAGLAAKISGPDIPEHEEPILLRTINFKDKQEVMDEISQFEASALKENIETACVITIDGKVYKCFGVENGVYPDFDLKDKFYGSVVSHNHPMSETEHSFSEQDLAMYLDYNLDVLRGCDELYTYELTRNPKNIDGQPLDWSNFENYQHAQAIRYAQNHNIGYRRWKNE